MALTSQLSTSVLQVDGRANEGGVIEIVPGARLLLDVGVDSVEGGALLDEIAAAVVEAQAARDEAVDLSGISTSDEVIASRIETPGTATQTALSATYGTYVNVKSQGVTGDGVTDDGPAIEAAAQALSTLGGGVLFFPAGTYRFHLMLLDGVSNVTFEGVGDETHFVTTYLTTDNTSALRWRGDNIGLRRLKMEPETKLGYSQAGFGNYELVRIGGLVSAFRSGVIVEDCTFIDGGGVNVYCTDNVIVRGNRYTDSHGNSFGAVNCISDILIEGNFASDGDDDLIAVTCDSTAAVAGGSKRVVVSNNILARTDAKCIGLSGCDGATISGNQVEESYAPAIQVFTDTVFNLQPSNRIVITNNVVRRGGQWFGAGKYHETAGNAGNGIHVDGDEMIVAGNLVLDTYGRGIQAPRMTRGVVENNLVSGSGSIGINIGDPATAAPTNGVDVRVAGNILRQVVGGISIGGLQGVEIVDNQIRDYKNGATGSRRGITYGNLNIALIARNQIINSDSGAETMIETPAASSTHVRIWGNNEMSDPAATDLGSFFNISGKRISYGTAAPTTGSWGAGDLRINSNPSSGSSAWAWICRTAGTPGTWQAISPVNLTGNANTWGGQQTFENVRVGSSATHLVGFYGATPIARQTGTPAAATDLATALTLVNDLRSKLLTLGVIA